MAGQRGKIGPAPPQKRRVPLRVHPEMRVPSKGLCRIAQLRYGESGLKLPFLVDKGDRLRREPGFQRGLGFADGEAAYVNAVDMAVGIKGIERAGVGAQGQIGRNQHCRNDHGDHPWPLTSAFFCFLRQPLSRLGLHIGFTDRFHREALLFHGCVKWGPSFTPVNVGNNLPFNAIIPFFLEKSCYNPVTVQAGRGENAKKSRGGRVSGGLWDADGE